MLKRTPAFLQKAFSGISKGICRHYKEFPFGKYGSILTAAGLLLQGDMQWGGFAIAGYLFDSTHGGGPGEELPHHKKKSYLFGFAIAGILMVCTNHEVDEKIRLINEAKATVVDQLSKGSMNASSHLEGTPFLKRQSINSVNVNGYRDPGSTEKDDIIKVYIGEEVNGPVRKVRTFLLDTGTKQLTEVYSKK